MLPNPLEEIARKLDEYNKRLSHLERLEQAGVSDIWLGAGEFEISFGAPSFDDFLIGVGGVANQGIAVWALSSSATEIVSANIKIPIGVSSVALDFVFAMISAVAGNIVAGFALNSMAEGESAANNELATQVIAVPGIAQEIAIQTITTTITIAAEDILGLGARRTGGDGGDTAAGDCLFLGADVRFT